MKHINLTIGIITVILIIAFSAVGPRREKAPPTYNPGMEVTVSGTVAEVREFYCPIVDEQAMHLVVKSGSEVLLVHLAPGRFMRRENIQFHTGDRVDVVGTRVNFQDKDALLAREITRGNESFVFRDRDGKLLLTQ